ncbi:unnamed protein product [Notodromas monacha]|uniref:Uncharacterized protein n=1 Tax=Notodromas monacha TaxID=399045 RepID=A0A7R9BT23_9CRUS|nr:unnamed protein product [Notodromas monacha]CAG0920134.1 unnamed protein product [Notodromas monacha]
MTPKWAVVLLCGLWYPRDGLSSSLMLHHKMLPDFSDIFSLHQDHNNAQQQQKVKRSAQETTDRPSKLSKKQAEDPDPTVQHERILKHLRDLHNLQLQHAAHQQFEDKQVEERQRVQMRHQQELEEMQSKQLSQMKRVIDQMQAMIDQHTKDQKTMQITQQKERDSMRIRQQAQLREILKEKVKNKAQQEHMQRQMEVEQLKRLQQERLRLHEKEVGLEKMRLMQQGKFHENVNDLKSEQQQQHQHQQNEDQEKEAAGTGYLAYSGDAMKIEGALRNTEATPVGDEAELSRAEAGLRVEEKTVQSSAAAGNPDAWKHSKNSALKFLQGKHFFEFLEKEARQLIPTPATAAAAGGATSGSKLFSRNLPSPNLCIQSQMMGQIEPCRPLMIMPNTHMVNRTVFLNHFEPTTGHISKNQKSADWQSFMKCLQTQKALLGSYLTGSVSLESSDVMGTFSSQATLATITVDNGNADKPTITPTLCSEVSTYIPISIARTIKFIPPPGIKKIRKRPHKKQPNEEVKQLKRRLAELVGLEKTQMARQKQEALQQAQAHLKERKLLRDERQKLLATLHSLILTKETSVVTTPDPRDSENPEDLLESDTPSLTTLIDDSL